MGSTWSDKPLSIQNSLSSLQLLVSTAIVRDRLVVGLAIRVVLLVFPKSWSLPATHSATFVILESHEIQIHHLLLWSADRAISRPGFVYALLQTLWPYLHLPPPQFETLLDLTLLPKANFEVYSNLDCFLICWLKLCSASLLSIVKAGMNQLSFIVEMLLWFLKSVDLLFETKSLIDHYYHCFAWSEMVLSAFLVI